jgi:hypothetical protein
LLYAAALVAADRPLVDLELAERLRPIVAETDAALQRCGVDRSRFWNNVVPWSAGLPAPCHTEIAARLAAALAASPSPLADDELTLRSGPLRAAWEARGPGLWHSLQNVLQDNLRSLSASVILVRPALGGGGEVFAEHSAISFEAMLANPHPALPEVVRLAWLLAQICIGSSIDERHNAAPALVPATLAAAEEVELARCDSPTVAAALHAWHLVDDQDASSPLAEEIWNQWQARRSSGTGVPPVSHRRDAGSTSQHS